MTDWDQWQEATETDPLAAAHDYVRRGWRVVPLYGATDEACRCRAGAGCPPKNRGKHPHGKGGNWHVLASGMAVQEWFEAHPHDNLGVVTGPASDLFVFDVDGDEGRATLAGFIADHGPMPPTRIVETGSGGLHYYFKHPATFTVANSAGWLGAGIDIRGEGGQVVAPPSRSGLGDYKVLLDLDPAVAPPWLLDLLRDHAGQVANGKKAEVIKGEPVEMDLLPDQIRSMLAETLRDGEGRHRHFYAIVAECYSECYTQAETVTIVADWCRRVGKFAGRVAAEVARAWVKIEAAAEREAEWTGETAPQGSPVAPADRTPSAPGESAPESDLEDEGVDDGEMDGGWSDVDLSDHWAGTYEPTKPTLLLRADGQPLLYRGMVHSFHGESESGKSLLAQFACAEVLARGGRVCYIDFESDASEVVGRMRELGAESDRDRFHYKSPELNPNTSPLARRRYGEIAGQEWDLIVIDGVTDALNVWGAGSNDNDEITKMMRRFPRWLARKTGAAVVMVDHVTKDSEGRGRFAIGGQAKMAGLSGAAYTIEVEEPFARGMAGELVMRIGKDRPGGIRGNCPKKRRASDRTQEAARVCVDGTTPGVIEITVGTPRDEVLPAGEDGTATKDGALMERISAVIEGSAVPLNKGDIYDQIGGNAKACQRAIKRLEILGCIKIEQSGRALVCRLIKPYRPWAGDPERPDPDTYPTNPTLSDHLSDQAGKSSSDQTYSPYGVGRMVATPESTSIRPLSDQTETCSRCRAPKPPLILERHDGYCPDCWRFLGLVH